ncbi:hypothetical protein E2562_013216 [Oryza meyeriana var. granulata]|uniref:Uncharacterized protein n=1 Tax=Oryza meyeriana var. granulata TaxID=110450 RepID=A0A6G1D320_9ORYZ|nr:hypothetical protein E2562_013216 [Oryza meyeriana var. granulata]
MAEGKKSRKQRELVEATLAATRWLLRDGCYATALFVLGVNKLMPPVVVARWPVALLAPSPVLFGTRGGRPTSSEQGMKQPGVLEADRRRPPRKNAVSVPWEVSANRDKPTAAAMSGASPRTAEEPCHAQHQEDPPADGLIQSLHGNRQPIRVLGDRSLGDTWVTSPAGAAPAPLRHGVGIGRKSMRG